MGTGLIRSRGTTAVRTAEPSRSTLFASFASGFALTLGDAKAILFYASLFPAFVDLTSLGIGDVAVVVLVTVAAVGGVKLVYAFAARRIVLRLQSRERGKMVHATAGTVMVGTGAYVITQA